MAVVERSLVIHASPEDIDAFTADAARLPEWYPGIESAQPDDVYPNVGGQAQIVYRAAGVNFNMTNVITEYHRGHVLAFRMDGMISGNSRYTLTPEGGGTRVTARFEYEIPGGGLGKVIDKLVVERMNTQNLEESLNNLKRILEG